MSTLYKYQPDYAVHPGETLREKLNEINMLPKEFAVRTGKPVKTISEILNGKSSITPEMAVLFEKVLEIPANFWIKKQANFNEFIAREEQKRYIMEQAIEWARKFPYAEIAKYGFVKSTRKALEKAEELLDFFGMSKHTAWGNIYLNQQTPVYFRISLKHNKDPYALSALLRMGEIIANNITVQEFSKTKLKSVLPDLKNIMLEEPSDFLQQIQNLCSTAGVKVIYTPNLPKTVIHGTVRWVNNTPVIQMTDRLKRYDIFWFSLFHEIGHIILHGNKKNIFLEEINRTEQKDQKEQEADNFAAQLLLKDSEYKEIMKAITASTDIIGTIKDHAEKFKTHKDIIIGRILYENKDLYKYGWLQKQIKKVDFNDIFDFYL
jgi:addiction module HigA family antidote